MSDIFNDNIKVLQYKKQAVDLQGSNKDIKLELERSRLTMEDENSRLQGRSSIKPQN